MVIQKKLVVVGNGCTGKTSLLLVFNTDQFPEVYISQTNHIQDIEVDGKQVGSISHNI